MGLSDYLVPCLSAFAACLGFCIIFNIRAPGMVICSIGGGLSWLVYLLVGPLTGYSDLLQSFWAAVFLSAYSEGMARVRKCPVTGYLLVAFLPLVPGGGIYYTMEHAMAGETQAFLDSLLHTLGLAGALAVGVLMVASVARLFTAGRQRRR